MPDYEQIWHRIITKMCFRVSLSLLGIDLGADTPGDNENAYVAEGCRYANVGLYKSFFKDSLVRSCL